MEINKLNLGDKKIIDKVEADPKTTRLLQNLGLMPGATIRIVAKIGENVIISVKNTRIAMDKSLAENIFVV